MTDLDQNWCDLVSLWPSLVLSCFILKGFFFSLPSTSCFFSHSGHLLLWLWFGLLLCLQLFFHLSFSGSFIISFNPNKSKWKDFWQSSEFYRVRVCRGRIDPVQWRTYLSLYRLFWSLWYPQWHQSPHRGRWSAIIIRTIVLKPLKCRTAWGRLDFTELSTSRPRLLQEKGAALQPRWVMGQHQIPSDPIRSIRTLQDSRLIPPTSLFYSFLHNDLTFLCPSHFVSVDSSRWRDVTHQILLFCFVFYPRWVSTSTRSCRKSGFLTWTLPMILPNRTLGPGRERTGAAWCCCAAVLDLMRGRSPVRCRRADVTAVIEFFYFQDGVGSPLMLGGTGKQVGNIRIWVSRGLN